MLAAAAALLGAAAVAAAPPAAPAPPTAVCQARLDAWCNNASNNPQIDHPSADCGAGRGRFYALDAASSSKHPPSGAKAWRCYGEKALSGANHSVYDGTSTCYSSQQTQLAWQLCACEHRCNADDNRCSDRSKPSCKSAPCYCGPQPARRGFPGPAAPPLPPAPPGPKIPNMILFQPGEDNRTGYRIPALLAVGNSTLFAFAESRTGNGDGDFARHPVTGDNRTAIVFKTSEDGKSGSSPWRLSLSRLTTRFDRWQDLERHHRPLP